MLAKKGWGHMTDLFVADMHFGSASNAKWRKFNSADEMDAEIATRWRERVQEGDVVWVLGDVGSLATLACLPGTKRLVFGNDDKPKGNFKNSEIFASWADDHVFASERGSIQLIHRPQDAADNGLPVLHGHTHSKPDQADPRFVSVSVDKTGWGPITLEEAWARFDRRLAVEG